MDSAKLISAESLLPSALPGNVNQIGDISEQKQKQAAKDFESVLLGKLLDEMKNTIGDWGFEEDAASRQTEGIFWLYLARYLGDNGGLGMWKDIYQTLTGPEQKNENVGAEPQIDRSV
jgi:Rod binding domain-containing protein